MSPLGFLLLAIIIALPVAWLISEFYESRARRITFGLLSLAAITFCVWALSGIYFTFNYNAWYGGATSNLIGTSLQQIEDGSLDRVLKVWRSLEQQYKPTYENRANYRDLVEEAVNRIQGIVTIEPDSAWDVSVFNSNTWIGHWENDSGFWLVVNNIGQSFEIARSGYTSSPIHSVSVSPDFTVLNYGEGERGHHTLTLKNKHEAIHQWFNGTNWTTETMYKLIRASKIMP